VFARLADVSEAIDLVDVFRRREALGAVVDAALALVPKPKVIWMQLGLIDETAAARAEAAGVAVVMDRCTHIEHERLIENRA
jgi:predicted CoA-binding protein